MLTKLIQQIKKLSGIKVGRIRLEWSFDAKSAIFSDPYIADINNDGHQEIIFGTKDGVLFVINDEGKVLWHYSVAEKLSKVSELFRDASTLNSIYGTPVAEDINNDGRKEIIFGSELGVVYCLSSEGRIMWRFQTGGAVRNEVIAQHIRPGEKKDLVFGSMDKRLYVVDCDGKQLFNFEAQEAIESAPVVLESGGRRQIIFGCNDGYVYSVNDLGGLVWKFKTDDRIVTQPVVMHLHKDKKQFVFVTSTDHCLYILDEQGLLDNKFKTNGQIITNPTVRDIDGDDDPEIFIGSCDDTVYALSPVLQKIWDYETNFWIGSQILVEDIDGDRKPEVIVGSYDKNLYIFDAKPSSIIGFMPGMTGILKQNSDYGAITKQAQYLKGRKIWRYDVDETITGLGILKADPKINKNSKNKVIVCTKEGKVYCFAHSEE